MHDFWSFIAELCDLTNHVIFNIDPGLYWTILDGTFIFLIFQVQFKVIV